jgi:hypothetical protein
MFSNLFIYITYCIYIFYAIIQFICSFIKFYAPTWTINVFIYLTALCTDLAASYVESLVNNKLNRGSILTFAWRERRKSRKHPPGALRTKIRSKMWQALITKARALGVHWRETD